MEEIVKLEEFIGNPVEKWTIDDMVRLNENAELLSLLKSSEVTSEILSRSKDNRDIADLFVPLYIKSKLTDAEQFANNILYEEQEKKITSDELYKKLLEMLNNDFYFQLAAYLVLISKFPDVYDCSKDEIKIKEAISNIKEITIGFVERDLDSTYTLIMELLELVFPLRSRYFEKYNVDILDDDDERLSKALDTIRVFEYKVQEELKQQFSEMTQQDVDDITEILDKEDKGEANE